MRSVVVAVVLSLLLAGVGMVAVASSTGGSAASEDVTPGEEVAGVVLVGEAELEAEVEVRGFGHALQAAEDPEERADLIAARITNDSGQLANVSERLSELEEQREAGEITEGQYRASVAVLAIQTATIERTAEQSAAAAPDVAELLAERGIDVEAIDELRTNASELRGQEVAEIARNITGDREPGPPGDVPANMTPGGDDAPGQQDGLMIEVLETNDSVVEGEAVEILVGVENRGDVEVEQDIALRVNGQPVDTATVTLAPGEATEVTLVWETAEGDAGDVDAEVRGDGERVATEVTVRAPAFFDVAFAAVPDEIAVNETAMVEVEVTNTGEGEDTQTIELRLGDEIVGTEEVTLGADESQTVEFAVETNLAGATETLEVTSDDAAVSTTIEILGSS